MTEQQVSGVMSQAKMGKNEAVSVPPPSIYEVASAKDILMKMQGGRSGMTSTIGTRG